MPYGAGALLAGGLLAGDHSSNRSVTVDLRRGVVHPLGSLVQPLHDSAGAVVSGRPIVVGGGGATELAAVQQMSAAGRWHVVGHLPGARSDLSVIRSRKGILVVGGYDGAGSPSTVLERNQTGNFHGVAHLPQGVRYAGVVRLGGDVWVLGGERDHQELDSVLRLDLGTGSVTKAGRMPRALGHEAVAVVGNRILVMGGRTSPDRVTDQMWWFDPADDEWRRAGRLPYPVADSGVVEIGEAAYLLGGEMPDFTDRVIRVAWAD